MKLSIVTICRNDAAGLARTLESTFAGQVDVGDWEQIIVDGASTDGSFAAVDKWRDNPHLGWAVSEPDKGIYNAMNKGAAHACGDWLLFLNAGDTLLPGVLRTALRELRDPGEVVYGDVIRMLGREILPSQIIDDADLSREMFLFANIPHQAVFVPRRIHEIRGGYDESFLILADWKFWLGCRVDGIRFRHIPVEVSRFAIGGRSSDPRYLKLARDEKYRLFEPVFGKAVAARAAYPIEHRPWIRPAVAARALDDFKLARCLRRSNDILSALWRFPPSCFLLRGLTIGADAIVRFGKSIQNTMRFKQQPYSNK